MSISTPEPGWGRLPQDRSEVCVGLHAVRCLGVLCVCAARESFDAGTPFFLVSDESIAHKISVCVC